MTRRTRLDVLAVALLAATATCDGGGGAAEDGAAADDGGPIEDGGEGEVEAAADADAEPDEATEMDAADAPDDDLGAGDGDAEAGDADGDGLPDDSEGGDDGAEDVGSAGEMTLLRFADAAARGLVCNNGTEAGYYFRRGRGDAVQRWVIHLQGGGYCYDLESCDQREAETPHWMTSTGWSASDAGGGILSTSETDNPDFWDANHVYVPYCSSDVWTGDREASAETDLRHFRGRRIVRAAIDDLADATRTPAPNLADATEVLFSGTSAGGAGMFENIDWLAGRLPDAEVRGVADSSWLFDFEACAVIEPPRSEQTEAGYALWGAAVDDSCAAANPTEPDHCYAGPVLYPYLETPVFVQNAQRDLVLLMHLGVLDAACTDRAAYVDAFAAEMRRTLEPLPAVFAADRAFHGALENATFWSVLIDGTSLREAIGNWFFGRAGPIHLIEI